ncbi:hypothetical protein QR98_0010170 [Sarcoptes scabiei]|uniref:Uncharacterized protein n=1 Tax=Sarcoptes scabiei TaxID=52283 RepID=A0A131ZVF6_SARSC|nr:hypothetical protein QR98_0010170 [Sarcoptes scabiei]
MPHKPGSFPCQNISPYRNESVSDSVKILGKKMTLKSTKLKSFAIRFYKFPNDLNLLIRDQLYLFPSDPNQIFYGDKER